MSNSFKPSWCYYNAFVIFHKYANKTAKLNCFISHVDLPDTIALFKTIPCQVFNLVNKSSKHYDKMSDDDIGIP